MSGSHAHEPGVRVTLPATSANLGPGFDALGLAMSLTLTVDAWAAKKDSVKAIGRDAALCGTLKDHLVLASYHAACEAAEVKPIPLALQIENEIPLGMGCGSSAAARLAGVVLASYFGRLDWSDAEIVAVASRLEGHPDNVAACWYGGFTVSVPHATGVETATLPCDGTWQLLLALPAAGVATETARAVLPESYSRADAVFNVQRVALLTAAFAQQRLDLLTLAMDDRFHQPYRRAMCPQLDFLEVLQDGDEFAGVALSGAGPALLTILAERTTLHAAEARLRAVLGAVELIPVRIAGRAQVEPFGGLFG